MRKFGTLLATAAFGAMAFVGSAFAGPLTVTFDDNAGSTLTLVDGVDDALADGLFSSGFVAVGGWTVSGLLISVSDPLTAELISASGDITGAAGHLTITITDTYSGITGLASTYTTITPSHSQGTLDYSSTVDGSLVGMVAGLTAPTAFEASSSALLDGSDFDIVQVINIFHSGAGQTTFDATTTANVPEPGILGFLGFGLLGMGIAARRRKAA